jgi:hypothetical protein
VAISDVARRNLLDGGAVVHAMAAAVLVAVAPLGRSLAAPAFVGLLDAFLVLLLGIKVGIPERRFVTVPSQLGRRPCR